jgi:hypothetical protein
MRFVLQFLFLLLLAVVLFGGEVVESACFVNDVSNDYIQAPASPVHKLPRSARAHVMSQRSINLKEELVLTLAVAPPIEPAPSSASDLLQLISIQRK